MMNMLFPESTLKLSCSKKMEVVTSKYQPPSLSIVACIFFPTSRLVTLCNKICLTLSIGKTACIQMLARLSSTLLSIEIDWFSKPTITFKHKEVKMCS